MQVQETNDDRGHSFSTYAPGEGLDQASMYAPC